jgi:hypothetical protein
MTKANITMANPLELQRQIELRNKYVRPLKVSLIFCIGGEVLLLLVFGIFLFPEGNLFYKILWALLFCGVGMGGALGSLINLLIVDRLDGQKAVWTTVALSFVLLGILCDLLCLKLDSIFNYFGGSAHSLVFVIVSMVLSTVAGYLIGWLCFTAPGRRLLGRAGL